MPPFNTFAPVAPPPVDLRPITVADYHAMGKAGIFREDERVELLDGCLLPMSPVGNDHFIVTNVLTAFFGDHRKDRYVVSVQNPIRLDDRSEPEPDVALLRPDVLTRGEVARSPDVLLLIEVADSTLKTDREVKRPRYAAAGIPEVWIVSTEGRWVEVAREPQGDDYRSIERFTSSSTRALAPSGLPAMPPLDIGSLFHGLIAQFDGAEDDYGSRIGQRRSVHPYV